MAADPGLAILILRPQPGAASTARRARTLGLAARVAPLFRIAPLPWAVPQHSCDALLLTSANALRHAGAGLAMLHKLPALCVGAATARAARAAGFAVALLGDGDAARLLAHPAQAQYRRILWLCGTPRTPLGDRRLVPLPVYQALPVPRWRGARLLAQGPHIILVHSKAAAGALAAAVPAALRAGHWLVAISPAVAAAAGAGWAGVAAAQQPSDAEMLAICRGLCQS